MSLHRQALIQEAQAFPAKRRGLHVAGASVDLIIFATLGVAALSLMFSATTTNWGTTVPIIAITVTGILFALSIAMSFFRRGKGRGI